MMVGKINKESDAEWKGLLRKFSSCSLSVHKKKKKQQTTSVSIINFQPESIGEGIIDLLSK